MKGKFEMKKKIWGIIIGIIIIGVGIIVTTNSNNDSAIRLAVNIPLSGPVAAVSGNYPKGFAMGLEDACKEFNIDPGKIAVDFKDNAANPATAVSVYRQQSIKDYDAYVVGTTESANAVVSAMSSTEDKPCFLFVYDAFMTQKSRNCFRVLPNFKAEAAHWIKYATDKKAKKIFMLTLDMSGTEEQFSKIIVPALQAQGITCIREIYPAATTDFRLLTKKISDNNPDLVFVSGYSFHLIKILSALRESNIAAEKIMCSMDFCDLTRTPADRNKYNGITFACPVFEVDNDNPKIAIWKKRYAEKYGMMPTYIEAFAYENAYLLIKTYAENGKISSALCKNTNWIGVSGNSMSFDVNRDAPVEITIAELSDGKIIKKKLGE